MATYTNIKIEKLPNSAVKIEGSINADVLQEKRKLAIKAISSKAEIDGFRKGKVPEEVLVKNFGEMAILEEAAELALSEAYPEILKENKIDAIGYPKISIVKLALGNPLEFKIETAVVPSLTLSDYKKSAEKIMSGDIKVEISNKEVADTIQKIQESRGKKDEALTDKDVKEFGHFKDLEDFKKKLGENMTEEKRRAEIEKRRATLMDELVKNTKIELPAVLVEAELDRMIGQLEHDIIHAGMKFEDYLKQVKKTVDEIRVEWKDTADKKARFQLILDEIAKTEKIKAPEDQVVKEIEHFKKHYPNADENRIRAYIETMLTNSSVMEWLESQGKKK